MVEIPENAATPGQVTGQFPQFNLDESFDVEGSVPNPLDELSREAQMRTSANEDAQTQLNNEMINVRRALRELTAAEQIIDRSGNPLGTMLLQVARAALNDEIAGITGRDGLQTGQVMSAMGGVLGTMARMQGSRDMMIVGEVLRSAGSIVETLVDGQLQGSNLKGGEAIAASTVESAGSLLATIGGLDGNRDLQVAGTVMQKGIGAWKQFSAGNTGQGATAAVGAISALIGGDTGRLIGSAANIASTVMTINSGGIDPAVGWANVVRMGLDVLGVDVPAPINYFSSLALTAAAGGPFGWAAFAIGTIFNFARMGNFTVENVLQENVDLDGDVLADDMSELRQEFRRGFFGNVKHKGSAIDYHINGVAPDLMSSVDFTIVPETAPRVVTPKSDRKGRVTWYVDAYGDNPQAVTRSVTEVRKSTKVNFSMGGQSLSHRTENGKKGSVTTYVDVPTGNYLVKLDANYDPVNPSVDGERIGAEVSVTPEERDAWVQFLGGENGRIERGDARLGDERIAGQFKDRSVEFEGTKNDPNYYVYMDMNGDGIPDLVRIGLQIDGLKEKGDGKVEVTLLKEDRTPLMPTYYADDFVLAEKIGSMSNLLMNWGTAQTRAWDYGTDAGAYYQYATDTGRLDELEAYQEIMTLLVGAMSQGSDTVSQLLADGSFARRVDAIAGDLGAVFDPNSVAQRYPDIAEAFGGVLDPTTGRYEQVDLQAVRQHYIDHGNAEGRVIDGFGNVAAARPDGADDWSNAQAFNYLAANPEVAADTLWDAEMAKAHYESVGRWNGAATDFDFDAMLAADPDLKNALLSEYADLMTQDGGWRASLVLPEFSISGMSQSRPGAHPTVPKKIFRQHKWGGSYHVQTPAPRDQIVEALQSQLTDQDYKTLQASRIILQAAGGTWDPFVAAVQAVTEEGGTAVAGLRSFQAENQVEASTEQVDAYIDSSPRKRDFLVQQFVDEHMHTLDETGSVMFRDGGTFKYRKSGGDYLYDWSRTQKKSTYTYTSKADRDDVLSAMKSMATTERLRPYAIADMLAANTARAELGPDAEDPGFNLPTIDDGAQTTDETTAEGAAEEAAEAEETDETVTNEAETAATAA